MMVCAVGVSLSGVTTSSRGSTRQMTPPKTGWTFSVAHKMTDKGIPLTLDDWYDLPEQFLPRDKMSNEYTDEYTDEKKEEIKRLHDNWLTALDEESDAASRASLCFDELEAEGIDANNPPDWVTE